MRMQGKCADCMLLNAFQCLFQWIETRKNRLSETPACPQCKRAYIIKSPRPLALRLFESCDVMMQQVLPYLGYAAASGAIVTTLTVYGAAAYTVWMGSTTASRELLGKWHWKVRHAHLLPLRIVFHLRYSDKLSSPSLLL